MYSGEYDAYLNWKYCKPILDVVRARQCVNSKLYLYNTVI
jgi:hypothetical protein